MDPISIAGMKIYPVEELTKAFKVLKQSTLWNLIADNKLRAVKVGTKYFIHEEELTKFLKTYYQANSTNEETGTEAN